MSGTGGSDGYELHAHTTASDGTCTPRELVEEAARRNLAGVAVTDHDTISGIAEATAAGRELGVEVIPGIEISADVEVGTCHILGYFFDPTDALLAGVLTHLRARRRERAQEMARRLAEMGAPIRLPERTDEASIGRPHLAQALYNAGHIGSYREAFERYLAPTSPAYLASPRLPPGEAIERIRRAGGISVLAHPHTFDQEERIAAYRSLGLGGIEAHYAGYNANRRRKFSEMAQRLGLLVVGGSDFHGSVRPDRVMGEVRASRETVEALRALARGASQARGETRPRPLSPGTQTPGRDPSSGRPVAAGRGDARSPRRVP